MSRTLVLGYGNPLRGDDALGAVAAEELARRFAGDGDVEVLTVHQLTPDLADRIRRFERVILVDARAAAAPGRLVCEVVLPDAALMRTFSHHVTPGQLLATAGALYGAAPEMVLTGLTATAFDMGRPLSEPLRRALPDLVEMISGMIADERTT